MQKRVFAGGQIGQVKLCLPCVGEGNSGGAAKVQDTTRPIRAAGAGPTTLTRLLRSVRRRSCPPNCPPSLLTCPGAGHRASQACTMAPFLQLTNL